MTQVTLKEKSAIKVNAMIVIWGVTPKAKLYNIDGDEVWIPNSLCEFTESPDNNKNEGDIEGTLIIQEWFYKKLFPNG